jgi:two-component system, cell cycle sensor histidine kinase and response regulator CckA
MLRLNFQGKLLVAMMVLVIGVTATTLLITENQVRLSYERYFQQAFRTQMQSFLEQQALRLASIRAQMPEQAGSPRVIAAMDNAGQPGAEQQDIDVLYLNGKDQLAEMFSAHQRSAPGHGAGFFLFLNKQGDLLLPSERVSLPFSLADLRPIASEVEKVGRAFAGKGGQQVGYLASSGHTGNDPIQEMVFTAVADPVSGRDMALMAVGFPLTANDLRPRPEFQMPSSGTTNRHPASSLSSKAAPDAGLLSGIWLGGRLHSSSIPAADHTQVEETIARELKVRGRGLENIAIDLHGVSYRLYGQALKTGPGFPPALQINLYSLAEEEHEKSLLRRKLLVSGTLALLAALVLSWLISRGLSVPLRELAVGTTEIEHGNYAVQVPVRGRDEVGRLAEAFNEMTKRIQSSYCAQQDLIAQRTQELEVRKRTEEALRSSEASLREAQRIAHLGNWQWDTLTNELRWSEEIYAIFGLNPAQFRQTYEAFLERVDPEDREKVAQAVHQALVEGQPYSIEHRVVRPDGKTRIVHERAEVTRDPKGMAIQMIGTVQDITEQKRIEAEFLRAQRLDSIGALAGGIAHDLNNALSPILMGIQLLRREATDPEIQQTLAVMEANTHRGAEMVRQVLTFARGHEGERQFLDVGLLVREMENIVRQTLPKSISVAAMIPSDLWPVRGNATQLHQILLNLCVNARDAMPEGGELVLAADNVALTDEEAREISDAKRGSYVMLLVSDTGTGIAPEIMPRMFEPFFTTKGPGKGTGLGLSTIARIVRNHGGFLSVKTEMEAGTSFEVYLPRAEPARPAPPAPTSVPPLRRSGHGERILFIDDDHSMREMVPPTLAEHGYRVVSAANGAEALGLLDQEGDSIRLALADIAMPVMGGLEMLTAIHDRRPGLPVILMSGSGDGANEALPKGAAGLLQKPFPLGQLLALIADALDAQPRSD